MQGFSSTGTGSGFTRGGLSGTEYMQDVCAGWGGVRGFGGGNTPRTGGPLLRCGGHGRRCHGPDAAHALAFRLTGVGEDVGHTVKVQTHVGSVYYGPSHTGGGRAQNTRESPGGKEGRIRHFLQEKMIHWG